MINLAVNMMTEIVQTALPVAVVIEVCNLAIGTFLRTAFGGRTYIGR